MHFSSVLHAPKISPVLVLSTSYLAKHKTNNGTSHSAILSAFFIFCILSRKIILNICSAKFYNHLRYPNISDSTESSKSIVCIFQLCFIKIYLFYCRIILLFCRYRKLYHVIYVNDKSKRIWNESVVVYSQRYPLHLSSIPTGIRCHSRYSN
jgi:hypothetical protein